MLFSARPITLSQCFLAYTFLFLISGCGQKADNAAPDPTETAQNSQRSIETIADEYLASMLERFPEQGTIYALPGASHDKLHDNSLESLTTWQQKEDDWLQELEQAGTPTQVGSRDWVTYGILHEKLAGSIAARICRNELWQASSATSWHGQLPSVFEKQPVNSADLQQQALDRLSAIQKFIDTAILNLRLGLDTGYSAPRVTVLTVPDELRALLEDDSPLLSPALRAKNPK